MIVPFHPGAEAEYLEAVAFYESRQKGLGAGYIAEVEEALSRIAATPHRYRIEKKPNIRRLSLVRFPYKIIYRDLRGSVQVMAVAHKHQHPGYWVGRL